MEWKHKKESKWLIVENRKVHCYLCGRKMLKASQRIYDAESGHYSHAICEKEKQLTGTNERRSAVKIIVAGAGVLGLTAVGVDKFTNFGRMSNSVFSSNAKDQTANPELETVITSQGIILPSLTSDPANPVAGQMWYRSDAGVTAHYDSIQNRVVYSSEINNGNVNVTSKGIVNGLSVLPNDGTGGFGPDSLQADGSLTTTSGIMEAIDSLPTVYSSYTKRYVHKGKILLTSASIYSGTSPIVVGDDDQIEIIGTIAPAGSNFSPSSDYVMCTTINMESDQGNFVLYDYAPSVDSNHGGVLTLDNLYFYSKTQITNPLESAYTLSLNTTLPVRPHQQLVLHS